MIRGYSPKEEKERLIQLYGNMAYSYVDFLLTHVPEPVEKDKLQELFFNHWNKVSELLEHQR